MTAAPFKTVVVGLGYFSHFHIAAWSASADADLVGVCDADPARLLPFDGSQLKATTEFDALVAQTQPDIVDIVAPPTAHASLIRASLAAGRTVICQKPFCTSLTEAKSVIASAEAQDTHIVIHENFRFQPWHRDIKAFLDTGVMGEIYQARFNFRPGDGRGPNAYLDRQPAFQTMPRLLIHETGVHFVDLFRWYFGDITSVYAEIRRLNPAIAGEDTAFMSFRHKGGPQSVFDGNRLSDHVTDNPRRTMGEMWIEGEAGEIRLFGDGSCMFRPFQSGEMQQIPRLHMRDESSFGGGCVAALINHTIASLKGGASPENTAQDYLHVMDVTEAAYASAASGQRQSITERAQ